MELDINVVAKGINTPVLDWKGHCHAIANEILRANLVKGRLRYGHYWGPIAHSSMFHDLPIVRHGWIELPDNQVYDPTRWVFEDVEPYIYVGPGHEYDVGGQVLKELTADPTPEFNKSSLILFNVPTDLAAQLNVCFGLVFDEELGYPRACLEQVFWVVNLPIHKLGPLALPVYEWVNGYGQKALIPFDNWDLVVNG